MLKGWLAKGFVHAFDPERLDRLGIGLTFPSQCVEEGDVRATCFPHVHGSEMSIVSCALECAPGPKKREAHLGGTLSFKIR